MSISTKSAFYYGHTVTNNNAAMDFSEDGVTELQATLNPGSYTLTEYVAEVERALNAAGALNYTVTVNRTTRIITVAASGVFELWIQSGDRASSAAWSLMGFTGGVDLTGLATYAGLTGSGSEFLPQAKLDNYIPKEVWKTKQDAVVNVAAGGIVQAVTFGDVSFYRMNVVLQVNSATPGSPLIDADANGLTKLIAFMDYLITKAPIEFMPDRATRATFDKLILESTATDKQGTEYQLKKIESVAGYYSSGAMVFRVVT